MGAIIGAVGRDLAGRSWGEVVDVWLAAACDSPSTRRVYGWSVRRAFAVMGAATIDEVTPYDLAAYREDVMASQLAPATKRSQIGALRSFLRWSRAFGICTIGPEVVDVALRMPSSVTQVPYTILSEEEIARLLRVAVRPRDRAMVMVMLGAGLRVSEVAQLACSDLIAGEPPYVQVRHGKGGHGRAVPVRPETMAALHQLAIGRPGDAPLFRTIHGPPGPLHVPGMRERLASLGQQAGIARTITPHALRHTYAVRALLHSHDVMAISKLLGHKQLSTTQRYLEHLEMPHLLASVPALPS